jgi:hypothetical protein
MVLDVLFLTRIGIVCAATEADPATRSVDPSHGRRGASWSEVYWSTRPGESVWKCSFPTSKWATRPSGRSISTRRRPSDSSTLRTGRTWKEILLVDDFHSRPQAVAFLTPDHGWVGTTASGFETRDGGESGSAPTWAGNVRIRS